MKTHHMDVPAGVHHQPLPLLLAKVLNGRGMAGGVAAWHGLPWKVFPSPSAW